MQNSINPFNIRPANRVNNISEYYFSKKLKEVAQMNAEGKDVISLGIGSPDMPPSRETIETLCNNAHDPNGHGYQPYVGIPELRKGFAAWYQRWYGVELNPNTEIQPLIGSKEGILHVTLAFVNPGEQVLVPNPGYPTYTSLSKILGAEVINYDLKEEDGWMPDFETLEKMDLSRVKLMWTNYPNMPTGANASMELYEKLVAFGKKHGIIICNDNPYSFILNEHPLSILAVPGAKDICIENHQKISYKHPTEITSHITKTICNFADQRHFSTSVLATHTFLLLHQSFWQNSILSSFGPLIMKNFTPLSQNGSCSIPSVMTSYPFSQIFLYISSISLTSSATC